MQPIHTSNHLVYTPPPSPRTTQKTGNLWKPISQKLSPYGKGHIITFQSRFTSMEEEHVQNTIFYPAIEPTTEELKQFWKTEQNPVAQENYQKLQEDIAWQLHPLYTQIDRAIKNHNTPPKDLEKLAQEIHSQTQEEIRCTQSYLWCLRCLGYGCSVQEDGTILLALPTKTALIRGWENLQKNHPELDLSSLDIVSAPEVSEDISFVLAYFAHDALLSEGKEFVHDHFSHIIPTLLLKCKMGARFTHAQWLLCQKISIIYRSIHNRPLKHDDYQKPLEALVAVLTDTTHNISLSFVIENLSLSSLLCLVSTALEDTNWHNYLLRRFPSHSLATLSLHWQDIYEYCLRSSPEEASPNELV